MSSIYTPISLPATTLSFSRRRAPRLFKTRRNGPAWTMATRAIRGVIPAARECAPWKAPSAEELATVIIDKIDVLDARSRIVLAMVFAELVRGVD
jgi:hypothetical protein